MAIRTYRAAGDEPELVGYVDREPDGEETYTVAPGDVSGYDRMSRWMTVPVAVVEDLEAMR